MDVKGKVFLVQWDPAAAEARACELRDEGWLVETEAEDGARAFRAIRVGQPDVVVIDLSAKPSHGREVARSLRQSRTLVDLPIVFVDGDQAAIDKARAKVSGAIFTTSAALATTLSGYAKSGNG